MSDEPVTKPTIETVLERLADLTTQLTEFRESMQMRFHRLEMKMEVLSGDMVALRADIRMPERMIEEPKAK